MYKLHVWTGLKETGQGTPNKAQFIVLCTWPWQSAWLQGCGFCRRYSGPLQPLSATKKEPWTNNPSSRQTWLVWQIYTVGKGLMEREASVNSKLSLDPQVSQGLLDPRAGSPWWFVPWIKSGTRRPALQGKVMTPGLANPRLGTVTSVAQHKPSNWPKSLWRFLHCNSIAWFWLVNFAGDTIQLGWCQEDEYAWECVGYPLPWEPWLMQSSAP